MAAPRLNGIHDKLASVNERSTPATGRIPKNTKDFGTCAADSVCRQCQPAHHAHKYKSNAKIRRHCSVCAARATSSRTVVDKRASSKRACDGGFKACQPRQPIQRTCRPSNKSNPTSNHDAKTNVQRHATQAPCLTITFNERPSLTATVRSIAHFPQRHRHF